MAASLRALDCGDVSGGETLQRAVLRVKLGDIDARIAALRATTRR